MAARFSRAAPAELMPGKLLQTSDPEIYQYQTPDKSAVAFFREESIYSFLNSAISSIGPFIGIKISPLPPEKTQEAAFLTKTLNAISPDWQLILNLDSPDPFGFESGRNIVKYTWTGVVMTVAIVDARKKLFTYCNAGHNHPLAFSPGNTPQRLSRGGAVLGVFTHWQYEEEEIRLSSGDRILMYTDGVTESRNAEGEEFGENQILDLVCRLPRGDASMLADTVVDAATRFSHGSFEDDLTVVALSVNW